MEQVFRLFDFNIYNENKSETNSSGGSDNGKPSYKDSNQFVIQMFGLDEKGKTCSIVIDDFKPFFYVKVGDNWSIDKKQSFLLHIKGKIGKYYENSITECKIIKRKKLYGFDDGKEYKFIKFEFKNVSALNKVKNLWYSGGGFGPGAPERKLLKDGYIFDGTHTYLYEANIPPLLRFFHIQDISPSGWVALPNNKTTFIDDEDKKTTCDFEFEISYKNIVPLNNKETRVPYKICSFDIEASSSHGDFPVPIKSYKKLATNIIEYFDNISADVTKDQFKELLRKMIINAFGYANASEKMNATDLVYPKTMPDLAALEKMISKWLSNPVRDMKTTDNNDLTIEAMFEKMHQNIEDDNEEDFNFTKKAKVYVDKKATIVDILFDKKFERDSKVNELNISLKSVFPKIEGDKVTFIGSTFMRYGETEPYLNHCAVLNTCDSLPLENSIVQTCKTERDLLMAWRKLIQEENPDIIIGYNIFGFDYEFMFRRAQENDCQEEFLQLSRNIGEICANKDRDSNTYKIEETTINIASGQHDLKFIKMNGRLQVDLYNFFRREENLTSYKLDYVAGHFIGDYVSTIETFESKTKIITKNMTGLLEGSFIHIEEIGHTTDYYDGGTKYKVVSVNKSSGTFVIDATIDPDFKTKKVRWCMAKDDVTPKDIFRMANGTSADRAVVAKYCIQDCNLVHYLMNKVDTITGFIEMAKICSVPMNFLVMRGQGIKLTSYIAKKCREKRTLMPVIEKGNLDEGFEGAIVLDPKCDLYLDNPVACVDYASLYPSSMISENLSHDSKVWTREYDLAGNLIDETGEKDENGNFMYDNLPNYEYVNIEYDTYRYVRKTPSSAAEKIINGRKICRFAQFPQGKAIMPSILEELLKARKTTRKLIPLEKDDFMKNVLDKRQIGYKLTANSLYGQCGAKTSTFYEQDIAACTTATGRLLLTYAKKIIEKCYGDAVVNTENHGPVLTKAEYIYGDSIPKYTPVYIKSNGVFDICTIEEIGNKYGNNTWIKCVEEGKQEKEFCELTNVETWTEKGWTGLNRIIRHELAEHKKIIRILTHTGLVDVTDDHSLLTKDATEISPKDVKIGTELLHNNLPVIENFTDLISKEEAQVMGFFFGDGSCGSYDCLSGKKSGWALNNASVDIINKYLTLCKIAYPNFEWVVMPTLESSGVYKISPRCSKYGSIVRFVDNYREKLYHDKAKKIPHEVLLASKEIRQAFWDGLYDADGDKDANGYTRIDQKSQISAAHICWLAQSLGWKTSINIRKDKQEIYRITMTKKTQRRNPIAVKKMQEIKYHGYVYDLTTENHHFAAGIGNIIVHNTDSVFFTFNLQTPDGTPIRGKEALEITIEIAQQAGHLASSFLKGPHDLEYEKTFMPFCLLSKKRYVGMLYEHDPNKGKRKEMGIVLKRRDNAPIVKDIYGGIIDILMKEKDIQKAIDFLKSCLKNIVEENYPIEKLIISKSLRSGYKNPKSIAHKVLSDRMTARDPGAKPSSGDRIPFVYINNSDKKALQGERIETPTYILENNLKIDYSFYITNQIMKPVQQVFALVLEKIWEMQKKAPKIKKFQKDVEMLKKSTPADKFEDKLEQMRNKEVKAMLFDEYLRVTQNEKQNNQALTKFFGKKK
jgi:DNA polymerase elongation subunit (family B)